MKRSKINIITLGIIGICLCACNLDRRPFTEIERDRAFRTVDDATAFNNALYAHLKKNIYGANHIGVDVQTDLFHASVGFGNRYGAVYRWTFVDDNYTIRDLWEGYYKALMNINNLLDNVVADRDADRARLDIFRGEAYFLRAFYYERLICRYAVAFNPSTASTDPGVPIVLRYDTEEKPARSSVEQVYQQILSDLDNAKRLLTTTGNAGSERLTADCVTALLSRVFLSMHRYDESAAAAAALISLRRYPLVATADRLRSIWATDAPDESIMMLYSAIDEQGNANSSYLGYNAATGKYSPDYIPEQWIIDLYTANDHRRQVYFHEYPVVYSGVAGENRLILLNKYPGNPKLYSGTTTNYQHRQKVFRIAEQYLIRAEALAWNSHDVESLATLNELRTARGLSPLVALAGDALKSEIKSERIREMIGEGVRLDDLKRWHDGIARSEPQNAVTIYLGEERLSKPADDPKFVWAIPSRDITTNPRLKGQQNPGW